MGRRSSMGYNSGNSRFYSSRGYGKKRKKSKTKWIIIIAALVILLAAGGVGAYFLFGGNNPKNEPQPSTPVTSEVQESSENSVEESSAVSEEESKIVSNTEVSDDPNIKETYDGNVMIYNKEGYETFYGTETSAKNYAATVSKLKKEVGDKVTVYNMVVPIHSAYGLPQRLKDKGSDQKENIETIYSSYSADVKPISVYDILKAHSNEYIYFHTDHNWTALGAYYAYEEFCKQANLKPLDLKTLSSGKITNFLGSLYTSTDDNTILKANPDTVTYYNIPGTYTCSLLENGKSEVQNGVPLIATFAAGSNAYSAFIWGDNPYMHIKNSTATGRKLCIIKDSYGCAFAPFTVSNYDEVFIVDSRYYEGNIVDYIKKNNFTDVLVINGIMSANTAGQITCIESIL
ncbi:MAG: DHHW family protein [Acutalibacteraceae bacterium]